MVSVLMVLTCGWFYRESKENSQTICWRIEKQSLDKGSKAGRGNIWEVFGLQRFSQRRGDTEGWAVLLKS
jgi:hypothetical protein